MNLYHQTKAIVALVAVVSALSAMAADTNSANPFLGELSKTTALELPAKSAKLVTQAPAKTQAQATADVVKAAVGLNPASAGAVVGTIAQAVPEMAPIAAGTAVSLVPNQAASIARVAAAAAPAQAGKIVEAVCRVLLDKSKFKEVALAVAESAPDQTKDILSGVSAAIPALQSPLAKIMAGVTDKNTLTVATVLDQVPSTLDLAAAGPAATAGAQPALAGPTFGAPYVPPAGSHQNLDPGSGGDVPTGGTGYVAP